MQEGGLPGRARQQVSAEIEELNSRIALLDNQISDIQQRIDKRQAGASIEDHGSRMLSNESRHDYLVRTGKITPFSKDGLGRSHGASDLEAALADEEEYDEAQDANGSDGGGDEQVKLSHQNLRLPGFQDELEVTAGAEDTTLVDRATKRIKLKKAADGRDSWSPASNDEELSELSEGNQFSPEASDSSKKRKNKTTSVLESAKIDMTGIDDGNEQAYQVRLKSWETRRRAARDRHEGLEAGETTEPVEEKGEWLQPHPKIADTTFEGGYSVPGDIYPSLFDYQKTGVKWLWELYSQQVGGIVGDEMGLGKTIQVISFLAGLHHSGLLEKPVIVVCPATVMQQWVNEFHRWWPPLRVSILHTSGSGMIDMAREDEGKSVGKNRSKLKEKAARAIVDRVVKKGHVLVTTYAGLQTYSDLLIPVDWQYAALDEGHKIRNPNTAVTIHCKELRTPNRIIISGTPMQNNLTELWSLFDFIFPMRLGTLDSFRTAFDIPIREGGFANASNLQVQTAQKCAETLKDTIAPYVLQRYKADVAADLPKKTERTLLCRLTMPQRRAYEAFLESPEMKSIYSGRRNVLAGVDILRKVCNHPDLPDREMLLKQEGYKYGAANKSGKLQITKSLIQMWLEGGHKILLFSQTKMMLDIIEKMVKRMRGLNYRRMDGESAIKDRQDMVDEFNKNPGIHLFLLTTKVGGLGVNLTGADRIIIYDPDWNPSTDAQARERAWRLGQKKEVEIYRLMIGGSIEEKIYHRQIFKTFLTNKVMKDPTQRQTFQMQDLHDLFSLSTDGSQSETGQLFHGTETKFDDVSNDSTEAVKRIAGVDGLEDFEDEEVEKKSAEQRVLEGIFSRAGVQSALEHDQIINGKKRYAPDPNIIEREAAKIAAKAARSLLVAGEAARHVPVGTVTWTGRFGTTGRPKDNGSIPGGGRQRAETGGGLSTNGSGPKGPQYAKLIQDYLNTHDGIVFSSMLVNHFNNQIKNPVEKAHFMATLKQLADLQRRGRLRGKWILKAEYRV